MWRKMFYKCLIECVWHKYICALCAFCAGIRGELCAKMPLFRLRKNRYTTTMATHSDGPAGPQ